MPLIRNAWAVPIAKFVFAPPVQITITFWLIALLVLATAARAEQKLIDCGRDAWAMEDSKGQFCVNMRKVQEYIDSQPVDFRPMCGSGGVVICPQNQARKDRASKIADCPDDQFHQKCLRDRILEGN